jgi:hypothetical protein
MLFRSFEGQWMLVLHRPFKNARGKLYEIRDAGDHLELVDERTDLDGDGRSPTGRGSAPASAQRPACLAN